MSITTTRAVRLDGNSNSSPFETLYNNPLPHHYFGFLAPVSYRAPDETMAVLRPWLAEKWRSNGSEPVRVLDFFSGYGANGILLRTGFGMAEISELYSRGALSTEDLDAHTAFFKDAAVGPDKLHLSALDIAPNALAYSKESGVYQNAFGENLLENAPSEALSEAAYNADIIIESGGHHEVSPAIIDGLLGATNPDKRPPLVMSVARDFDLVPIRAALAKHGYEARLVKPDFLLRTFVDDVEKATKHERTRALGLPEGGVLGDNVRYANLFWAEFAG
ncbi:MAG: hypothetical protein KI792_02295 [Alphaproteobacteria bacterium]|nr:hypothetical protein [Alphaproteobacteria bacterium SS10]